MAKAIAMTAVVLAVYLAGGATLWLFRLVAERASTERPVVLAEQGAFVDVSSPSASEEKIVVQPIGFVHSPYQLAQGTPIQGVFDEKTTQAWVELKPQYARGLKDLDGFSHAILLYQFHLTDKVEIVGKPYLENEEHGIFAIRSPHRPNHLGLSVVKIQRIDGNRLHFTEVDVLDGTPVLDIKPYVKQFDCRVDAVSGWVERHYEKGKSPDRTTAR